MSKVAKKVMLVGRATTFAVGLAVILALTVGLASTALAGTGIGARFQLGQTNTVNAITKLVGSVAGPSLQIDNNSTNAAATALDLQVEAGKAPMKVNSEGKVANLNADKIDNLDSSAFLPAAGKASDADKLDGMDSTQILPLVRSQKDGFPAGASPTSANSATLNTVSINAPTDGFLVIWGSTYLVNQSSNDMGFITEARLDGNSTAARGDSFINGETNQHSSQTSAVNTTQPVSAGAHTVTLEANRYQGSGPWFHDGNNLSVMFVPAERGAVSSTTG